MRGFRSVTEERLPCWFTLKYMALNLVYQRRLWGMLKDYPDLGTGNGRAVSFDLDSTDIPWNCEPSPPPVVVDGG